MAALTADTTRRKRGNGVFMKYPVYRTTTIYKGSLVSLNATGYAIASTDAASTTFVGIATEKVNNSAGSDGTLNIRVETGAEWLLEATSITQAMVGTQMYVVDSDTIDDAAGPTHEVLAGVLTEYVSNTLGWTFCGLSTAAMPIDGVTSSAAELNMLDGSTAGTVVASKAVVVNATKDVGDFRNLDAVNIDAGSSGAAGTVDIFPGTAASGKIAITAADQAGDTTLTIVNASMAAARTITIPDPGAAAKLLLSTGTCTASTVDTAELNNLADVAAGTVTASKALVVGADKNLDTLAIADGGLKLGAGAGTAVASTAAELNKLDESVTAGCGFCYASGTIAAAAVKTLRASPVQLVASPGAGRAIVPYLFHLFMDFGTVAFTQTADTDHLALQYAGGVEICEVGSAAQGEALVEAAADAGLTWVLSGGWVPTAHEAIRLDNNGAAEYGAGDGVLDWYLIYAIVPVA